MSERAKKTRPPWEEIFAALGDGLVILDEEKRVIGMNPAAESITGFSAETTLGRVLEEAFPENLEAMKGFDAVFHEGGAMTLHEVLWRGRNGAKATVDLSATPLIHEEGDLTGWILVFRDMTPVKNLEADLRKADRLAMIGTIAAGLAHEIKNPLGGIRGAAQILSREKLPLATADYLQIIVKEVDRVDRLVSHLLALGRPKGLSLEPININELLDAIALLEKGALEGSHVQVIREFDPSLPPILGDADELRQAFLNFVKNAIEAVPENGGRIRIRSRLVTNFRIKGAGGKKASRVVKIEVQDNGVGISSEDLEKVFTPFFTTKKTGSGLGLAIAQRIVHEHGGLVRILSGVKQGTTVQVFLRSVV